MERSSSLQLSLPRLSTVTSIAHTPLTVSRALGQGRAQIAGKIVFPSFPKKITKKASFAWKVLLETAYSRAAFLNLWLRRGLGIVQPR
ncbi:MAG TPA: hypothetical protein VGN88_04790, partial [Phycisphaerae bacterium]